jgi:hypothetical protein
MPEVMASAATPAPPRSSLSSASQHNAARKDAKLALHLAVVIGVVVLAIAAGLVVASRMRGDAAPAASGSSSAAPAAPSSSAVLTIPPIEVR